MDYLAKRIVCAGLWAVLLLPLLVSPPIAAAQDTASRVEVVTGKPVQPSPEPTKPSNPPNPSKPEPVNSPTPKTLIGAEVKRWIGLDAFSLSTRYRYVRSNNGLLISNSQQFQLAFRSRFKFDKSGRYSVNFGLFTGNTIIGGWNNTGLGTGDFQSNLYLKQLFFRANPVKEIEVQVGGLGINNGENTEITGYDNDAYITGERVAVRSPKKVFFDEISATNGFLGDAVKPNIFRRLHRLNESNYHQFLVRKQITKQIGFSADYTFEAGRDIFRQAVKFKLPKKYFLDTLLFENYERVSTPNGYGFDIFTDKAFNKKFVVNGGFARIDRRALFNGDRFPPGKRICLGTSYKLIPDLTLTSVIIQGVGQLPSPLTSRTRFEIILNYNVLTSLQRHHIF